MAVKSKNRQRKLNRKTAKRKAKRAELARQKSGAFTGLLAAGLPVLDCCVFGDLDFEGMGSLLVSRKLPDRRIAFAVFLIDAHCLGIKDSFARAVFHDEYSENFSEMIKDPSTEEITPADARKLVEDAVEFARSIGFAPQGEYRKASAIFTGIGSGEGRRVYGFGVDGKPRYVNGPHDSPQDIERIQRTLEAHCGPDGYETVFMLR
jgi:hypothetical protein